jgi:hypothetical protein
MRNFVLVPDDKACNTIVSVCKAHYYSCINELGIYSTFGNPIYTPTALSKDAILQNHRSVLDTFNIPVNGMNEFKLSYLSPRLLLADLFLFSYDAEFIQKLLHEKKKKSLAVAFNSTCRYIDDVLSINNNQLHSYVDTIYPNELEIKDAIEHSTSASYSDVLLNLDTNGKITIDSAL